MSVSESEAAEALSRMRSARVRANEMKRLPFVYHLAVGALMGGWVAIQGLDRWSFGLALLLFLALTWAMYRWQLKATGRWIHGFRPGWTLIVAVALLGVVIGLLLTSNPAKLPDMALFTPVQGGLIAFAAATLLDWLWVKVYDIEIRGRL
ncbi:MAG TPA: hypothetical protein VF548_14960 [Allosphingosinicella sp.]|jgi:uncharacterized membrane protein HdeD (DUF308 family)